MLNNYLTQTEALLQLPGAPSSLYTTADLTRYINIARGQIAGEGECIRAFATISLTTNSRGPYSFASLNFGASPSTNGIQGAIKIESLFYVSGSINSFINPRPWNWFVTYAYGSSSSSSGVPTSWAQYSQGAEAGAVGQGGSTTVGGSFYVDPPAGLTYTLSADCVCYPQPLASDGDVEALPYFWTDCVPFFAAYYALLSAQNNARMADAQRYLATYKEFVGRARQMSNASINRWQSQQADDPIASLRLAGGRGA